MSFFQRGSTAKVSLKGEKHEDIHRDSCALAGIFLFFNATTRRRGAAGMGISREPSGFQASPRRWHFEACAGEQCHVLRYSAAGSLHRAGLASWRSSDPCQKSSLRAGSPTYLPAVFVIERMGQVARRTPILRGFPRLISSNKWPTTRVARRKTSVPKKRPCCLNDIAIKRHYRRRGASGRSLFFCAKTEIEYQGCRNRYCPEDVCRRMVSGRLNSGEKEPIGQRIIEVPEDLEQFENRDPRSQFIAYVPIGSIAKGAALVSTGGEGKTLQCAICHGQDLKGLGGIPSIVGRSPSYVVRQLYDIQNGARAGMATQLMKATVANLTVEDMVSIAAYLASQTP